MGEKIPIEIILHHCDFAGTHDFLQPCNITLMLLGHFSILILMREWRFVNTIVSKTQRERERERGGRGEKKQPAVEGSRK